MMGLQVYIKDTGHYIQSGINDFNDGHTILVMTATNHVRFWMFISLLRKTYCTFFLHCLLLYVKQKKPIPYSSTDLGSMQQVKWHHAITASTRFVTNW